MLKSKRIVSILLIMVVSFSLFAGGSQEKPAEPAAPVKAAAPAYDKGYEGPTTPSKAPEDLKLAVIIGHASMSGASIPADAMVEIANHFGWEVQTWDGQGSPDVMNPAIMSAIAWGADAILMTAQESSSLQAGVKAAVEAGIPIGCASAGTDTPNPVIRNEYDYVYDVGASYNEMGHAMAEWMYNNIEGSGKVACWDFEGAYSIDNTRKGLYEGFEELGMDYDPVGYFTFDLIGDQLNRQVTTYLTNNPDTEFIFFPFDPAAVPVSEALELAGFTDVKVASVLGNIEMCALISQDTVASASAAYDNTYLGYAAMDQMIRHLNGDPLFEPHGENTPYAILDITNVPSDGAWAPDFDYKSKFYALWE